MTENGTQRDSPMPRVQKSLMVPADLYRLVQVVEAKSGATFTRIVTAALLAYFFEDIKDPEHGGSLGPDPFWMTLAVHIERGDIEVADIPLEIAQSTIKFCEAWARVEGLSANSVKETQKRVKAARVLKGRCQARVQDEGGKMEALIDFIQERWVSKSNPMVD